MIESCFFEIPVYRCNQDTHAKEMKNKEIEYTIEEYKETAPSSYQNMINYFNDTIWYPWKYNEIIGWIYLYVMGTQLRGEYYFTTAKRIGKGINKKKFKYCGKAFEHSLTCTDSSNEIFKEILTVLEKVNKNETPFKKRYLDLRTFKTVGEFVDWKNLVEKLNSFKYPKNNN